MIALVVLGVIICMTNQLSEMKKINTFVASLKRCLFLLLHISEVWQCCKSLLFFFFYMLKDSSAIIVKSSVQGTLQKQVVEFNTVFFPVVMLLDLLDEIFC